MTNPTVDVMVLFSNQAAAATSDMEALALGSIQSSNDSFSNSDAGVTFNLVHHQQISYNESGFMDIDLENLENPSDGIIDNIHSLRDQHGADVVVLIVDFGVFSVDGRVLLGIASDINVGSSEAFAVVNDQSAVGDYTFAHEVGHLAGARHDNDGNSTPYNYGHGFKYIPAYWRTVMATNEGTFTNRIPFWSNPNKYYGGVAMGTTSWRDNARVWDVRASTMAGFRDLNPSVNISGPVSIETNESHTYSAAVTGGAAPFSYQWAEKTSSGGPWVNIGTGSSISYSRSTTGPISLRVIVTDDDSNTDDDIANILVTDGSGCIICKQVALPEGFAIQNNYPNPFNPSTQIKFELPETADVSIKVYNIVGQEVATLINDQMQAGFHNATFKADNLASGLYIARLTAVGSSGEQFVSEIKMQLIK